MYKHWTMALLGLAASATALAGEPQVGKWEYTSVMKMDGGPAMPTETPQLPPGMKLPPGVQLPQFGPKGMTMSFQRCVTRDDLVPKNDKDKCTVTKMERKGNTVTWAASCDTPGGKAEGMGTATYTATNMTSTMTTTMNDKDMGKIKMTQETTGHYVGACQ